MVLYDYFTLLGVTKKFFDILNFIVYEYGHGEAGNPKLL